MSNDTPPTPEEDEAFSALSRKQEAQAQTYGEAVIWLPEGEYTETQIKDIVRAFERMRMAHTITMRPLGGGH